MDKFGIFQYESEKLARKDWGINLDDLPSDIQQQIYERASVNLITERYLIEHLKENNND